MMINEQKIERVTQRLMDMLGIEPYIESIEFKYHATRKDTYGYMIQENNGLHKVVINVTECGGEKGIIHTMAHELRHVWQSVQGFDLLKDYHIYRQTYNTNIYELDADRFADMIVYKKRYKANEDGLYISNLDIVKHSVNTIIAKAIA